MHSKLPQRAARRGGEGSVAGRAGAAGVGARAGAGARGGEVEWGPTICTTAASHCGTCPTTRFTPTWCVAACMFIEVSDRRLPPSLRRTSRSERLTLDAVLVLHHLSHRTRHQHAGDTSTLLATPPTLHVTNTSMTLTRPHPLSFSLLPFSLSPSLPPPP